MFCLIPGHAQRKVITHLLTELKQLKHSSSTKSAAANKVNIKIKKRRQIL